MQKINLSQPAFSALIAAFEDEVGYRLFDRDKRKVQLNGNGINSIDIARRLILLADSFCSPTHSARRLIQSHDDAVVEDAVVEIKSYATGYKGQIVLAVLPSMAAKWLPQVLAQHHRAHPDIKLSCWIRSGIAA
ncbi:MAG: LysR family transcriptional regulator [Symbiopectobacterium sp.]